jgi:PTS system mannose-specific IIC component
MSIQTLALMSALGTFLTFSLNYLFGMSMLERPIVIGAVVGLLLGDVKTGVLVGVALEVAFMGVVNIGGVTATDSAASTAIATAFAVYSGLSIEETVAVAIPIGLVSNAAFSMTIQLSNFGAPILDKICERGDQKGLYLYNFIMFLLVFSIKPIVVYIGVLAGAEPITQALANIPPALQSGITAASGLLGAVGMAMLLRMLWTKEIAVYFFLGFVFVKYLNIPTMGIATIAVVIAVVTGMRDMQLFNLEKKTQNIPAASTVSGQSEEEDFLA